MHECNANANLMKNIFGHERLKELAQGPWIS